MKKVLLAALLAAVSFQSAAAWQSASTINEWTDEKQAFAGEETLSLFLSCDYAFFKFNSYMKKVGEPAFIKIRVDKNEMAFTTGVWQESFASVDYEELERRGIIEQMKSGNTMIFGAGDYRGNWRDKKITLIGFTKSIEKMSCK